MVITWVGILRNPVSRKKSREGPDEECTAASAVPSVLERARIRPGVENPGYYRVSIRDKVPARRRRSQVEPRNVHVIPQVIHADYVGYSFGTGAGRRRRSLRVGGRVRTLSGADETRRLLR